MCGFSLPAREHQRSKIFGSILIGRNIKYCESPAFIFGPIMNVSIEQIPIFLDGSQWLPSVPTDSTARCYRPANNPPTRPVSDLTLESGAPCRRTVIGHDHVRLLQLNYFFTREFCLHLRSQFLDKLCIV